MYRIEIKRNNDHRGRNIIEDFAAFGITGIRRIEVRDVYYLDSDLSRPAVRRIARDLLCDPVVESFRIGSGRGLEVLYNPGVSDPREASIIKAVRDLGIAIRCAKTAVNYRLEGEFDRPTWRRIEEVAARFLFNPLIQHLGRAAEEPSGVRQYRPLVRAVDLDADLLKLSRAMGLSLSRPEMEAIRTYFTSRKRMPTDVEVETIAQTWSEHCGHKTFRGKVIFGRRRISNLLKNTIMRATREIDHPLCLSVFHDNSGIIDFDETHGVCFKVETHNHPSALEPYGGAATGIGGVIRDILGTGLGAKPIMNTDVFCFGPPGIGIKQVPAGILHPRQIIKGVYQGVRDYGNRIGIPTASGAVYYDRDFIYNPLVYCGTVGLIRKDRIAKQARPGDAIMLVGGKTGRDGIHGATFSSIELSSASEKSCVQIGNPIMEKRVLDCLLKVSDLGLATCVTDCGGGGLSSAVGEMGKDIGARVDLDKVPLKYRGLSPREIWISESQERMVLAVPRRHVGRVTKIFRQENVAATVIGHFSGDRKLILAYNRRTVGNIDMAFLHDGLPLPTRIARRRPPPPAASPVKRPADYNRLLLGLIGSLNCCSREWIIREYDHEVMGGSVIKPLVGKDGSGPGDAVVVKPKLDTNRGVAVSCGINPAYGKLDARNMALSVVDEALRNLVAVGGDIRQAAMLDNFCFSSPYRPEVMADIVLSAQACYDAARAFGVPFISGKDSLNNEWADNRGRSHLIPPTLLISVIGIVEDVDRCVTCDFKETTSDILLVGETKEELGGSEYFRTRNIKSGRVPGVNLDQAPRIMRCVREAVASGLILACHDPSEGGLGIALAEMALAGNIGAEIDLGRFGRPDREMRPDYLLFAESNTRFIIEVRPERRPELVKILSRVPVHQIGRTVPEPRLTVKHGSRRLIDLPLTALGKKRQRFE